MATIKRKNVNAVVVGMGVAGTILAKELVDAGLKVVGLERGPHRDVSDIPMPYTHDELRFARRHELMQDLSRETITFRNAVSESALPVREFGSFLIGEGLGGSGFHWDGTTWRFLPWDFETRSRTLDRYGRSMLSDDCTSQDWGLTYDELEPYYDRFEKVYGISGKAGNLQGKIQAGGNPFEGPRSSEYPNPPMKTPHSSSLFRQAAESLGYKPFTMPSANSTRVYTNPYGATLGACVYCGYCGRFGCEVGAKASPQTTVLPSLLGHHNFELRTHSNVTRVNLDNSARRVTGVTYIDARGRQIEQPADIVLLASYTFSNVRLMLLSGIGQPYDPDSGHGVVGRNYSYQHYSSLTLFFEELLFNQFMGAGALGAAIDEFNGDNFDHGKFGFIGGGTIWAKSEGVRPIVFHPVPKGTPKWGGTWKAAAARYFNRSFNILTQGGVQSYRGNYLSLDPTYRDSSGLPLLRMTFDFGENERKMSSFLNERAKQIASAIKPSKTNVTLLNDKYSVVRYQSTHNTGGAVMGADPATSAVNKYLQSWDVPNLFVVGASAFPQNPGYNPTGTVGALSYLVADAITRRYIKSPGFLA